MPALHVRLFGKFSIQRDEHILVGLDAPKTQELFCYLLLHRMQQMPRETLAALFWGNSSTAQSKKCLRQALWQLQTAVESSSPGDDRVLVADHDWVQLNAHANLDLDVAIFEQAFTGTQGVSGEQLTANAVQIIRNAVDLYHGDLLEGCYQEWCLYERERLQYMYLVMLDKLMGYCEAQCEYEAGLVHGLQILRYDRAHERTHRRIMRLYYLSGDRVAALRQYQRCFVALQEELGVQPATHTVSLYKQIQADHLDDVSLTSAPFHLVSPVAATPLFQALAQLEQFSSVLADLQRQVHKDIQTLIAAMNDQDKSPWSR